MDEKSKFRAGFKKGVAEGMVSGSVFDKDMSEENVNKTEEVNLKRIVEHLSGKKNLTPEEQENLIRLQKYNKKL